MPRLTKNDWQGLWSVLWRTVIFAPVLWVIGFAWLLLVVAVFVGAPLYAVIAFFAADWTYGVGALAVWAVALYFRRPILRWTLQGLEHIGI